MHGRRLAGQVLLGMLALVAGLLMSAGAAHAATGTISGRVTGADGQPLAGVTVFSVESTFNAKAEDSLHYLEAYGGPPSATTDEDGRYRLTSPTGNRHVAFVPRDGVHAAEWSQDTRDPGQRANVSVSQLLTVPLSVDARLEVGATITGSINVPPGSPGWVDVIARGGGSWTVDYRHIALGTADSTFRIGGLVPGSYVLCFRALRRVPECWHDKPLQDADDLVVTSLGEQVTGIHAELARTFTIRARVVGAEGSGLAGAKVVLHARQPDGTYEPSIYTAGEEGRVEMVVLPGTYKVEFRHDGYLTEWYDDALFPEGATEVTGGQDENDAELGDVVLTGRFTVSSPPTVSGTPRVDQTLTASPGTWSPAATFTWQWLADNFRISGATGPTYKVRPADVGKKIRVRVTATRAGYQTRGATSAATTPVARATFVVTRAASISGTLRVGYLLTANPPLTSPAPAATRYQWLRNGLPIAGATARTYRLTSTDKGKRLGVRITLTRPGYVDLVGTVLRSGYVG